MLFKKIIVSDNDVPYASELFLESEFTVVLAGNLNESKTNQKVIRKKTFTKQFFVHFKRFVNKLFSYFDIIRS